MPYHAPLHPGRVLTTFGFVSAIVEALNGWGASYSANQSLSHSERNAGHALIKTSLLLQLAVIALFVALAGLYHHRCAKHGAVNRVVRSTLITLYISVGLILVRTIFRTAEYFGVAQARFDDPDFDPMSLTPLLRYEAFFYVFEGALMLINCVMFNWQHPRRYLPENSKIYLSAADGTTEIEGPGYEDGRPFWRTLVDPFDIHGLLTGESKKATAALHGQEPRQ